MKTALITGITGQDGKYLAELLLSKNYKVVGLVSSDRQAPSAAFSANFPDIEIRTVDFQDAVDLDKVMTQYAPNEFYNLVAASSVKYSFGHPIETAKITAFAPQYLLEVLRNHDIGKEIRFYQASSSEMYGDTAENPKTEETKFAPRSPYAVAKVFAHQTCKLYRDAYGMFVSCGILFNHESIYRSEDYVSRKISHEIARIALGKKESFTLGALTPRRDWGFAGDYVEAMWLMLQHSVPDDFIIASGESHSVLDFLNQAAVAANLPKPGIEYIHSDPELLRPLEIEASLGDPSKAKRDLKWNPKVSFDDLVKMMVTHDLEVESKK